MTADSENTVWHPTVARADVSPREWDDLLTLAPAADYSHTVHWHDSVCRHRPGARQQWWTIRRDGHLVAGMGAVLVRGHRRLARILPLHRLDSSIDGTSGGPVLAPSLSAADQDRAFLALVAAFHAARPQGASSAALALNPLTEARFGGLMAPAGVWTRHESPTAMVSLAGGIDTVSSDRLVTNKRNERNRGLRRGAEVFATRDSALLAEYYGIYRQASAHWGIVPTPLALLQDLLADPAGRVFFTCVRLEGKVIGGHLCLHLGTRVFAWNGVTDPAYARTHFPATLCFWGDLVEACQRGAEWLDFGASGGVNSLAGFKKYFGADLKTRGYYVSDSSLLGVLRRGGGVLGRLRHHTTERWHDGNTGQPRSGGAA